MNRLFWIVMALLGGGLLLLLLNASSGQTLGFENHEFASLVYLSALAIVIAAALLGRRQRLSGAAANIAIWLFLLVMLVGGYQYRYELQDFAHRVTAGLVPGSPLSLGVEDGRATVTLEKAANGHFEARVLVNGTPTQMVVDTGATATVLTAADAQKAGYDVQDLDYYVPVSTANGIALAARATAEELGIGGIERRKVPVLIAQNGMLGRSLLGMNFIGTLSGFDMRGDRIILRD